MTTHDQPSDADLRLRAADLTFRPGDHGRPTTDIEFEEASYEEPWRFERVNGMLVVMPPSDDDHSQASTLWRARLIQYQWCTRPGLIQWVMPAWVRIPGGTDRIGDVGVYFISDQPAPTLPFRVPELLFEIVDQDGEAHDRDYVAKRGDYHRVGVREYVIIDRFARRVTVLSYTPEGYEEHILSPAEPYTSPLLPGLAIPLADVFA